MTRQSPGVDEVRYEPSARHSMSTANAPTGPVRSRRTQAERSARSRGALLESAARGFSRYGYSNLLLEDVAREAGYTRGALYHQFKHKEDLALAVIEWVNESWLGEVGAPATQQPDPVSELLALARGHATFCRRDIARVVMALRMEFAGRDHPVGPRPSGSGRAQSSGVPGSSVKVAGPVRFPGTAGTGNGIGVVGRARGSRDSTCRPWSSQRAARSTCRRGCPWDRQRTNGSGVRLRSPLKQPGCTGSLVRRAGLEPAPPD